MLRFDLRIIGILRPALLFGVFVGLLFSAGEGIRLLPFATAAPEPHVVRSGGRAGRQISAHGIDYGARLHGDASRKSVGPSAETSTNARVVRPSLKATLSDPDQSFPIFCPSVRNPFIDSSVSGRAPPRV